MASWGNTLSKSERLSGKKSISTLLADGKWGVYGHFRYCWRERESGSHPDAAWPGEVLPGRILVSVPKKYFKRAVKRNLLKRRIREAYRVRKIAGVDLMFQYNSAELADFDTVSTEVAAILSRIKSLPEDTGKS